MSNGLNRYNAKGKAGAVRHAERCGLPIYVTTPRSIPACSNLRADPKLSCDRCCRNPPLAVLVEFGEPCTLEALLDQIGRAPAPKRQIDPLPVRRPPANWQACRPVGSGCRANITWSHKVANAVVLIVIQMGMRSCYSSPCLTAR